MIRLGLVGIVAFLAFQSNFAFAGEMQSRVVVHGHFGNDAHEFGYAGIEDPSELEDGPIIPVVNCHAVSDQYIMLVDSPRYEIKIYTKDGTYQHSLQIDSIIDTIPRFIVMDIAVEGSSLYLLQDRYTGVRSTPEMTIPRFAVHHYDIETDVADIYDVAGDPILGTAPPTEYRPRQPVVGSVQLYVSSGRVALYDRGNHMTHSVRSEVDERLNTTSVSGWSIPTGVIERDENDSLTVHRKGGSPVSVGIGGIRSVSPDGHYLAVVSFGTLSVIDISGNRVGSFRIPERDRGKFESVRGKFKLVSSEQNAEVYECYVGPEGVFVLTWVNSH